MNRHFGIDSLRLVMALMVVGIHSNFMLESPALANHLTVNGLFRIAVPMFFIINGFYLKDILLNKTVMWKWSKRILLLYAFWMVIYVRAYFPLKHITWQDVAQLPLTLAIGYQHLWYLPGLLLGGWLVYLGKTYFESKLAFAALALFCAGAMLQYLNYYNDMGMPYWLYRNFLFFAFPMIALGYLMRTRSWERFSRSQLTLACGLGLAGLMLESYIAYRLPHLLSNFDMYFSILLLCPPLFLLIQRFDRPLHTDRIAKLSSAIYFTHPLFIGYGMKYFAFDQGTVLCLFASAMAMLSFFPLYLLSKRLRFIL